MAIVSQPHHLPGRHPGHHHLLAQFSSHSHQSPASQLSSPHLQLSLASAQRTSAQSSRHPSSLHPPRRAPNGSQVPCPKSRPCLSGTIGHASPSQDPDPSIVGIPRSSISTHVESPRPPYTRPPHFDVCVVSTKKRSFADSSAREEGAFTAFIASQARWQ